MIRGRTARIIISGNSAGGEDTSRVSRIARGKALDLDVPATLLAIADEVIE
jgi:hypothetical protein